MRTSFINQLIEEARHNDKIFLLEDGRITQSGDYSDISYFNEVLS